MVNQLGKHDFSCDFFYHRVNMKDRKCFSDKMNRNRFDPILARRDWSCFTMTNLRCLNSAVNKLIKQSRAARNFLTVCYYVTLKF